MKVPTRNVLVVDDDEDDFILVRHMLGKVQQAMYVVDWASSYQDAWQMFQENHYDVVLMDYDLGAENGLDLIRKAVENNYPFPIILYTGRGSEEVDLQAMHAGASLYLAKSEANPQLLERSIRYAIERKQIESSLRKANAEQARLNQMLQEELDRRVKIEELLEERNMALQKSQDHQRLALTSARAGVWEWDIVHNQVSWSAELYDMFRMDSQHPVNRVEDFVALIHPEDRDRALENMQAALTRGGPFTFSFRVICLDGEELWVNSVGSVKMDSTGQAVEARGINQDISLLKEAEQARRDSERRQQELAESLEAERARLAAVLENLPVGVWLADQNGKLVGKNEQADQIWAGDAPLLDSIENYPEYPAWFWDSGKPLGPQDYPVAQSLLTRQPVGPVELCIRRFDGSSGTILVSAAPIRNKDGELTGVVSINLDVTSHKQAELDRERLLEENLKQRKEMELLIQNVPVGIAVLKGPEHRYTLTNPHQDILTRGKGSTLGRTVAEVWPEGSEQVLPILDQVYQTGEAFTAQDIPFKVIRDRGPEEAYFNVSYIPLKNQENQVEGILALAVETTDQVRLRKGIETQEI